MMQPHMPLSKYLNDDYDVIFNDHNCAMNNGAFFLRTGDRSETATWLINRWIDLTEGRIRPHRNSWPFTDNGSMLEALLELDPKNDPSPCANAGNNEFYPCIHREVDQATGKKFDGTKSRDMYGKVRGWSWGLGSRRCAADSRRLGSRVLGAWVSDAFPTPCADDEDS